MYIFHHIFPFPIRHRSIIIFPQLLIYFKKLSHPSGIIIRAHTPLLRIKIIFSRRQINLGNSGRSLCRIKDQLIVSILCFRSYFVSQSLSLRRNITPKTDNTIRLKMIHYTKNGRCLHLRFPPKVILTIFRNYISYLFRISLTKYTCCPIHHIIPYLICRNSIRIPCVTHNKINGKFFGFKISYIYNPKIINSGLISQIKLLS